MRVPVLLMALMMLPALAAGQTPLPYPTDATTGRAIGANEMAAQELKKKLDSGEQVLIIDVREAALYEKETIPGPPTMRTPTAWAGRPRRR